MAMFKAGDMVRVRVNFPPTPPSHIRTPCYIRGYTGKIERLCGQFGNPEELAFGRRYGQRENLYRVRFRQAEIWPDYEGTADDHIELEIYECWLVPAEREKAT